MKHLNNQLRELVKGLTLSELAFAVGMHKSQLSPWLRGDDFGTVEVLNRICSIKSLKVYFENDSEDILNRVHNAVLDETRNESAFVLSRKSGISIGSIVRMRRGTKMRMTNYCRIAESVGMKLNFELK